MRVTASLSKGFWGRSLDEFKRISNIVVKQEGIKGPQGPYILHSFSEPESIQACKVMGDKDIGGYSKSTLDWVPFQSSSSSSPDSSPSGYARFHGTISTQLPKGRPDVQRSGYAAFRTGDRAPTLFGKSMWDVDPYVYLALRVKSDGRSYFVNVQTESVIPTDLHQHRLFAKRPGEWETVLINWNHFVRTNHGFVVEPQAEILRHRVRSIGIGLTDRVPGPFEMCVEKIWATNTLEDGEAVGAELGEGELKNRQGQSVKWVEGEKS